MDTATAEPTQTDETAAVPEREAFSAGSTSVLFMSRRRELRLVRVPRYPVLAPGSARQVGENPGECVNFMDGRFVVPLEGEVTLEDGRPVDAGELIVWLEKHRLNGDVNGGFWRVDEQAPPVSQTELEALVRAADEHDEQALLDIIRAEEQGWGREQVLKVARGSLERVQKVSELLAREAELEAREAALNAAENEKVPAAPVESVEPESALLSAEAQAEAEQLARAEAEGTTDDREEPQP